MTALIMKDIATLKKTLILAGAIFIAICAYDIYEKEVFIIPLTCAMLPLILSSISMSYDTKSNFEQLLFAMHIKKSSYVFSKLFFAFIFGMMGSLSMLFLLTLQSELSIGNIVGISVITLIAILLISAIQLPFILKFGAQKARLIILANYFGVLLLSSFLRKKPDLWVELTSILSRFSMPMVYMGFALIGLLLIAMAIKASMQVIANKEY